MWLIGIKSGLITVLGLMAYGLLAPMIGLQAPPWSSLAYGVLALGIYSGHYYYKVANSGAMTYRQGLKLGLIVSVFTGLIQGSTIYLYTAFAGAAYLQQLTASVLKALQQKGVAASTLQEVAQCMEHMTPAFFFFGTLGSTVLLGFAFTLVIAALARQEVGEDTTT